MKMLENSIRDIDKERNLTRKNRHEKSYSKTKSRKPSDSESEIQTFQSTDPHIKKIQIIQNLTIKIKSYTAFQHRNVLTVQPHPLVNF